MRGPLKRILLSQRLVTNDTYAEQRSALALDWGSFFSELPAVPIAVPYEFSVETFFSEVCPDGVILSGGNDLSVIDNNGLNSKRDELEAQLLQLSLKAGIPVLGVCRGAQFLAAELGGEVKRTPGHVVPYHEASATEAASESRFGKLVGAIRAVNSSHSYGIDSVPVGTRALVKAFDGTVEAFEHLDRPILALLWHPERKGPSQDVDRQLVRRHFELEGAA